MFQMGWWKTTNQKRNLSFLLLVRRDFQELHPEKDEKKKHGRNGGPKENLTHFFIPGILGLKGGSSNIFDI